MMATPDPFSSDDSTEPETIHDLAVGAPGKTGMDACLEMPDAPSEDDATDMPEAYPASCRGVA